jgi:c-di-GMP-binding flagellar brake protein YcgR
MDKDIPLTIETLSRGQAEALRINSPYEIKCVMNYIAEKGNRVALYYGEENQAILTTLLAVDADGIWLEQSPSKAANKALSNSSSLVFVSSHSQVKVQFTSQHVRSQMYQGYPAFQLPFPESLYRLQRREYYRLATPVINPLRCAIILGTAPNQKTCDFIVADISCGGIGLVCTKTDGELAPGQPDLDFQITLPKHGTVNGTLVIRNLVPVTTPGGSISRRAGCEFKNLDAESHRTLQQYVTAMQRARAKL